MIIHDCEQNSPEWLDLHIGMPTSSAFSKMVTSTGKLSKQFDAYARQLAADKYAGKLLDSWNGNQWTERGHELEDSARAWYENTFQDRSVSQVGFITNDGAGCSPDGLVAMEPVSTWPFGILEIKCLKATSHIEVIEYYRKHKKTPPSYFIQTQGQMLITARRWVDLLFYHPDLPPLLIRQESNPEILATLELHIKLVIDYRDQLIKVLEGM